MDKLKQEIQKAKDNNDNLLEGYLSELLKIKMLKKCQCETPDREPGYTYCQRCNLHVSDERMEQIIQSTE